MIRVVQCVNMQRLREKVRIMSVNQMAVYHTILEVYNIMHNSSSEQIKNKYTHQERQWQDVQVSPTVELNYSTDCQIISKKPKASTPSKP